jgi:hypothetical protein
MNNGFKRKLLLIIIYYWLRKKHSYIKFLHKARNLWLQNFKSLFFRILCFVVFCKKSAKVIILTFLVNWELTRIFSSSLIKTFKLFQGQKISFHKNCSKCSPLWSRKSQTRLSYFPKTLMKLSGEMDCQNSFMVKISLR